MAKAAALSVRDRFDNGTVEEALGESLSFLRLLWEVSHALEQTSKRMEARLGITAQQRMTLRMIGKFPGVSSGELATLLHVDAGTASAAIRRLEARGLVERSKDRVDRRRVTLELTRQGRKLDQPDAETVEAAVEATLEAASPREVAAARKILVRLVASMASTR